ncbi:carboxypeptidase-like regulatory domain-containing protein [Fulvivirgaceae bacterium BMA12]|uniref:Carboxypeptidase-like regulatory domain-containing protein n=1 Tax=Agaribacillus aureus TaxID=3051825 RepID=A0ABT8LAG0_9BACT|nr:carboxypeptidase-like regulatory domain-containing protein [Fulvivirgaceae bacterium BMA12]
MMRAFSLISVLLLAAFSCFSQEHFTIYGVILDEDSGEPLPYATIKIKDKPIGTVANGLGEFGFHIPEKYVNDTLIISMLGYESFQGLIHLLPSKIKIRLIQKPIVLKEVTVLEKNLDAEQILKKALANIHVNYPIKPHMMEAFFRQAQTTDAQYVAILEAAVKIHDPGYTARKKEEVAIAGIRKSHYLNTKKYLSLTDTAYIKKNNTLVISLRHNAIRQVASGSFRNIYHGKHSYELDTTLYYDGRPTFIISATPKVNRGYLKKGQDENRVNKILIDAKTYAIVKVIFEYSPRGDYAPSHFRNVTHTNDSIASIVAGHTHVYEFSNYNGRYYLKYVRWSDWVRDYNLRSRKVVHINEYRHELLINKISTDPNQFSEMHDVMAPASSLYRQGKHYQEVFWEKYNVIYESAQEKQLINNLLQGISNQKEQYR